MDRQLAAGKATDVTNFMSSSGSSTAPPSKQQVAAMTDPKVVDVDGLLIPLETARARFGQLNGIPALFHLEASGEESGVIEQLDLSPVLPVNDNHTTKPFLISVKTAKISMTLDVLRRVNSVFQGYAYDLVDDDKADDQEARSKIEYFFKHKKYIDPQAFVAFKNFVVTHRFNTSGLKCWNTYDQVKNGYNFSLQVNCRILC